MTKTSTSGIQEFLHVVGDFKRLSSLAVKGVLVAPATIAAAKLAPPPVNKITIVATVMQLVSLVWVFQFWSSVNDSALKTRMRVAGGIFLALALSCFLLIQQFTVPIGHGGDRVVIGYEVKPEVKALLSPTFGSLDALRSYEYDPDRIWTAHSLIVMRVAIALVWVSIFIVLTLYLGAFVTLQRRRSSLSNH